MVKMKYLIIALLVLMIGVMAIIYFSQSEEKKVKRQFDLLSEWMSKDPGENVFTMMNKMKSLGSLFDETCELKIPAQSLSGAYGREEIVSYAAHGRSYFSQLYLKFYDFNIIFPERGLTKARLTARLAGRSTVGEHVDEAHELECVLKKIENKWLLSDVEVVEVLKK